MTAYPDPPHFELRSVYNDGREEIGLYTLEQAAALLPGVIVSRRNFVQMAALLGGALVLSGCSGPDPSQTPTPTWLVSPSPTRSNTPARAPTTGVSVTDVPATRAPATNVPATKIPSTSTPVKSTSPTVLPTQPFPTPTPVIDNACMEIKAHKDLIMDAVFSPNGAKMASISLDKQLIIWNVTDWQINATYPFPERPRSIAFSPDGKIIAVGGDFEGSIYLLNAISGELISTVTGFSGTVQELKFSPTGKYLAAVIYDFEAPVQVWSVDNWKVVASFKNLYLPHIDFSPDGKYLAYSGTDIDFVNTTDWTEKKLLKVGSNSIIKTIAFHPNSTTFLYLQDSHGTFTLNIYDLLADTTTSQANRIYNAVWKMTFSKNGKWLAMLTGPTVYLFDTQNYALKSQIQNNNFTSALAFSPDSPSLMNAVYDRLQLWEMDENGPVKMRACLFNNLATSKTTGVVKYQISVQGIARTYILPSTSALPAGATCTCNAVFGTFVPAPSGGAGGGCSCNQVCTCIPVRKYCFVMFTEERDEPGRPQNPALDKEVTLPAAPDAS